MLPVQVYVHTCTIYGTPGLRAFACALAHVCACLRASPLAGLLCVSVRVHAAGAEPQGVHACCPLVHVCLHGVPWHTYVHTWHPLAHVCACMLHCSTCVNAWYPLAQVCSCVVSRGTFTCVHGILWHTCVHASCIVAHACACMAPPCTHACMPCALYARRHTRPPLCQREGCCQLLLGPEPCHLLVTVSNHTPHVRVHVLPLPPSAPQQRLLARREPSAPQPLLRAPGHEQVACSIRDGTGAPAVSPRQPFGNRGSHAGPA